MAESFDSYRTAYGKLVEDSISFSGLQHDFFLAAKADLLERLLADRGLASGNRPVHALDVGCGIGAFHPLLRGRFASLSGCDISGDSIARARHDNSWVDYTVHRAPSLPYKDGRFDLAFAICVVHHVPPAQWPAFLGELKRVVRPGGIACIIEHNPYNPLTRFAVLRCPFDEDAVLLTSRTARRLFYQAGFSEIESEHFLLLPSAKPLARMIEKSFARVPLGAQYACIARA
ncbi:methyltransferase domain-containing protein [Mesorhizobium sp. WSM2239]|uniref:Methyltransferase domain-containing protein n=2 Tax=unclassified Mesorhizobium TaxID=325217 RepID=A0AAU8D9W9_9HYPH